MMTNDLKVCIFCSW